MKTSSAKAKGRRLQQLVRDELLRLLAPHGIVEGDITSTIMGVAGVDVNLSPAAKRVLNLCIECKAVEALNVVGVFQEHNKKYSTDPGLKILVHTRNHMKPLVTLEWSKFLEILSTNLTNRPT